MYKFLLLLSFLAFSGFNSFAQETPAEEIPVYLRFPTIPQFTLAKAPDSISYTRDNLKKKVNTLFFIFSPDCNHCQYETGEIIKRIK